MEEHDLGYMKATVEQNTKQIERMTELLEAKCREDSEFRKEVRDAFQDIQDELDMYKFIVRIVKLLGATALLVLTFKFGDISDLWKGDVDG